MSVQKRIAFNTIILYGRMAITMFVSLYSTRTVLKVLGSEGFGVFNLVAGSIVLMTFLNTSMASASQRFMSYAKGSGDGYEQKKIFNTSLLLHIIIALLIALLLEQIFVFAFDEIFKIPNDFQNVAKKVYQYALISTFITVIVVPYDAVINARENMLFVAITGIVESLLKLGSILVAEYYSNYSLEVYSACICATTIIISLFKGIYCSFNYEECAVNFFKYIKKKEFKEISLFASWSLLGSLSGMTGHYGQGLVMNSFFGPVVNAAQGVANQVSGQLGVFASTMLKAVNPTIAKSEGAGDRGTMLMTTMTASKISFFLQSILFIPALLHMDYILDIWLKNVPEHAVLFCSLLLVRNLIEQLFVTLSSSVAAVGKIKEYQIISSCINLSPLVASYLLFKYGMPPEVLYLMFIISSIVTGLLLVNVNRKYCGLESRIFFKNVVLRALASFFIIIMVSAIPLLLHIGQPYSVLLSLFICLCTHVIVCYKVGLNSFEKRHAEELLVIIKGKIVAALLRKNINLQTR